MRNLQQKLCIARGERPAELLFKNANLVNVLSGEIHRTHVAVEDGRVVGLGDYEAHKVVDLAGSYLAPSLIDGHFHVESSMLTAPEFARAVVPHGTGESPLIVLCRSLIGRLAPRWPFAPPW